MISFFSFDDSKKYSTKDEVVSYFCENTVYEDGNELYNIFLIYNG